MASGRPSRRRQMAATAAALLGREVEIGRTACARVDEKPHRVRLAMAPVGGMCARRRAAPSGGTGYSRSPRDAAGPGW